MRPIVLSMCVFAAACSDRALNSPTSPTSAAGAPAQTQAQHATQLPFRGSFSGGSTGGVNCPPTCPPTTLRITGSVEGTATHLGRFTATSVDVVNMASTRSTGTFDLTAANGDHLFTTTTGIEDEFVPPNISPVTLDAMIVGGTGRFVAATGTFTMRRISTIDFAAGTASESGSFEGQINLNK
jgi:hypothetical protein